MKGLYLYLAGLLVLVVALAGCLSKASQQAPASTDAGAAPAVEGEIAAPADDSSMQIEQPQSSADETVDLGSLI